MGRFAADLSQLVNSSHLARLNRAMTASSCRRGLGVYAGRASHRLMCISMIVEHGIHNCLINKRVPKKPFPYPSASLLVHQSSYPFELPGISIGSSFGINCPRTALRFTILLRQVSHAIATVFLRAYVCTSAISFILVVCNRVVLTHYSVASGCGKFCGKKDRKRSQRFRIALEVRSNPRLAINTQASS